MENYIRSKSNAIQDRRIEGLIDDYRENISKKITSLTPEIIKEIASGERQNDLGERLYVSIKLDGISSFYVWEGKGKSYLCNSPYHRVWLGLPALESLDALMEEHGIAQAIIAGELVASQDGASFEGRSYLSKVMSIQTSPADESQVGLLGFKAFDVIELNEDFYLNKPFDIRLKALEDIFPDTGRAARVLTYEMKPSNIPEFFDSVVRCGGHEGIIIRSWLPVHTFKVKETFTVDAVVIGACVNERGLREVLVAVTRPDNTYITLGPVMASLRFDQKEDLLERLTFQKKPFNNNALGIDGFGHDHEKGTKRPFQMVKPRVIVQVRMLDLHSNDMHQERFSKKILRWDEDIESWIIAGEKDFVIMKNPWLDSNSPIRDDKDSRVLEDTRMSQVTDLLDMMPVSIHREGYGGSNDDLDYW